MSITSDERDWYLSNYATGGWHADRMAGYKKWSAHLSKLLKDGCLERDDKYEAVYRITEKGVQRLAGSRYKHFLSRRQSEERSDTASPQAQQQPDT